MDTKTSLPNDSPLTPMRFLQRSAEVFPNKDAIVDGARRYSYLEFAQAVEELSPRHPLAYHDGRPGYIPRAEYTRDANRPLRRSAGRRVLVALNSRLAGPEVTAPAPGHGHGRTAANRRFVSIRL